jgi:hypothetical protein
MGAVRPGGSHLRGVPIYNHTQYYGFMNKQKLLGLVPWLISLVVVKLAVLAWGGLYQWHLINLSLYQLFPLFGLIAFSLMWAHYATGFLKQTTGLKPSGKYHEITAYAVLLALLAHPGLLALQLYLDGQGLPPGSELHYIPALSGFILLGMLAWTAFLLYESRRWFKDRSWFKYVAYLNDAAMLAVVIHSLKLGSNLQAGWFHYVWLFYAASLIVFLVYKYFGDSKNPS